ncbi:hypothetical protein [Neobacillus sp. D3-1R]
MTDKSWRVKSYKEGKYTVSIRKNLENDRVDEGDFPEKEEKGPNNKRS